MTDHSIHYECDLFEWAEKQDDWSSIFYGLSSLPHDIDFMEGLLEQADNMYETWQPEEDDRLREKKLHCRINNHKRRVAKAQAKQPFHRSHIDDLLELQDGRCCYCGVPFDGDEFELEHMLPISRGGLDDTDNVALACRTCNVEKRTQTAEEYLHERDWQFWISEKSRFISLFVRI